MKEGSATVAQLSEFDEIIDARSPAEYAEDHIPGAVSCPVLDDDERARTGTLYKQDSPFVARKVGSALVARHIAEHLEQRLAGRPPGWRPLVYCWRGGQRSGAFVSWLRMVGWDACQLEGGYKAYRRHVVAQLAELPKGLSFRVVCGATGSAKTRLLEALAAQGAQVLDLEFLAAHKGSVLGSLPGHPQPTQKRFESALHEALLGLKTERPVYVEAESRKIGNLHLPEAVIAAMRASPCLTIDASSEARIEFLLRDYAYLGDDAEDLCRKLACLRGLQSNATIEHWQSLARAGDLRTLFGELMTRHYDPLYARSQDRNYAGHAQAQRFAADDLRPEALARLAQAILRSERAAATAH